LRLAESRKSRRVEHKTTAATEANAARGERQRVGRKLRTRSHMSVIGRVDQERFSAIQYRTGTDCDQPADGRIDVRAAAPPSISVCAGSQGPPIARGQNEVLRWKGWCSVVVGCLRCLRRHLEIPGTGGRLASRSDDTASTDIDDLAGG